MVDAIRVTQEMLLETPAGMVKVHSGEWLITNADGAQFPCADEVFRLTYEPADEVAEELFRRQDEHADLDQE